MTTRVISDSSRFTQKTSTCELCPPLHTISISIAIGNRTETWSTQPCVSEWRPYVVMIAYLIRAIPHRDTPLLLPVYFNIAHKRMLQPFQTFQKNLLHPGNVVSVVANSSYLNIISLYVHM